MTGDKTYTDLASAMETAFGSGGWPAAARRAIEILIAQRKAGTNPMAAYSIAAYYSEVGDKEHAFEWLNTAYEERNTYLIFLRTDSAMESLRSDPRYAALERKIGFPQ